MGDLVKVDENGIVNILNNGGALNIGRPFSQEIFLIEVEIAGTSHVENMLELEPKLIEGTEVKFFRECDNRFDGNAILVKDADGNKLGYVPRVKNEILARLMDAGKFVFGRVKRKERVGDWVKVVVEVFLRD